MPETTNRQPDNRLRRLFAAITAAATLMILWVLYDFRNSIMPILPKGRWRRRLII